MLLKKDPVPSLTVRRHYSHKPKRKHMKHVKKHIRHGKNLKKFFRKDKDRMYKKQHHGKKHRVYKKHGRMTGRKHRMYKERKKARNLCSRCPPGRRFIKHKPPRRKCRIVKKRPLPACKGCGACARRVKAVRKGKEKGNPCRKNRCKLTPHPKYW